MPNTIRPPIEIGLTAAIVAMADRQPMILVVSPPASTGGEADGLPFGPFDPIRHRTLDMGLSAWVEEQTALKLGHVEQLYTFGDRGRHSLPGDREPHLVSVGYLALTRTDPTASDALTRAGAAWRPWYTFFPWEDWRNGRPDVIDKALLPALRQWAQKPTSAARADRPPPRERIRLAFGPGGDNWDEERALDRYELLYSAGIVSEASRDGRDAFDTSLPTTLTGAPMRFDHRRILATAISRLRGKLKYRPVVFDLMPPEFTLTQLQHTVEALSGRHLHKQNFRRLVEAGAMVEQTGRTTHANRGRPAALFRFRREVFKDRPAQGLRVGSRS